MYEVERQLRTMINPFSFTASQAPSKDYRQGRACGASPMSLRAALEQ